MKCSIRKKGGRDESLCERFIEGEEEEEEEENNNNKLYTVLSYWGVFTFRTCCILICLVCIVASFKLSCV